MSKVANTCVYCDMNFSSKIELKKHIEVNVVTCKLCECEFVGEKKYFLHIKNCAEETLNRKNVTIKDNLIEIAKLNMLTRSFAHIGNENAKIHHKMLTENIELHKKISVIDNTPKFFRKFSMELAYQFDETLAGLFEREDDQKFCDHDEIGWWNLDKTITLPMLIKIIALGGDRDKHTRKITNYLVNSNAWIIDNGTSYINHILNELIPVLEQFYEGSKFPVKDISSEDEDHNFMREVEMYKDAIFKEKSRERKDLVEQVKNSIFMENYQFLAEKDRTKNNK